MCIMLLRKNGLGALLCDFPQDRRGIRMAARRTQKGTGREDAVDDVKWVSETTPSE